MMNIILIIFSSVQHLSFLLSISIVNNGSEGMGWGIGSGNSVGGGAESGYKNRLTDRCKTLPSESSRMRSVKMQDITSTHH